MTSKIGFIVESSHTLPFFMPVLRELPPDRVDVLLIAPPAPDCTGIEELAARGFHLRYLSPDTAAQYNFFVADYAEAQHSLLAGLQNARFLGLTHATDGRGDRQYKFHFNIFSHKNAATPVQITENLVFRDSNEPLCDEMTRLPFYQKREFAYTGPYHLGEWLTKRQLPKEQIRQELQEKLHVTFPQNTPIVACYLDEYSDERMLVKGIRNLSRYATIIFKTYRQNDPLLDKLHGCVTLWPDARLAPNLMRFSADAILCGYASGTFITSVMLGQRVLPYYTQKVYTKGTRTGEQVDYPHFLTNAFSTRITTRCAQLLQRLYDIEDTGKLATAVHDNAAWDGYDERLLAAQRSIFGDYCLDGADKLTAMLIMKAFSTNTFGKYAHAIHVTTDEALLPRG